MKEILIILDGLMEEKLNNEDLGALILGKSFKNYNLVMTDYKVNGKPIDSLNCIFNILGYSSNNNFIGDRAYYEGLSKGIKLKDNETILRCNVIKINDGKLKDFTGGNLNNNLKDILNRINIEKGKIIPCDKYKNLLILQDDDNDIFNSKYYEPHFNIGEDLIKILPNNERLKDIIYASKLIFNENNLKDRIIWPWGPCKKVELESFKDKYNKVATMISGIDLVCGMGLALGMKSIKPSECNGYDNTSLNNKLKSALNSIETSDIVIVHINGLDELAHKKLYYNKIEFIKCFKDKFLKPLINDLEGKYKCKFTVTCDHRTDSFTGKHEEGLVPKIQFVI